MSGNPVLADSWTAATVYSDENYADTVAAQARAVADGETRTRNIESNEAVTDGWRGGPQAGFDPPSIVGSEDFSGWSHQRIADVLHAIDTDGMTRTGGQLSRVACDLRADLADFNSQLASIVGNGWEGLVPERAVEATNRHVDQASRAVAAVDETGLVLLQAASAAIQARDSAGQPLPFDVREVFTAALAHPFGAGLNFLPPSADLNDAVQRADEAHDHAIAVMSQWRDAYHEVDVKVPTIPTLQSPVEPPLPDDRRPEGDRPPESGTQPPAEVFPQRGREGSVPGQVDPERDRQGAVPAGPPGTPVPPGMPPGTYLHTGTGTDLQTGTATAGGSDCDGSSSCRCCECCDDDSRGAGTDTLTSADARTGNPAGVDQAAYPGAGLTTSDQLPHDTARAAAGPGTGAATSAAGLGVGATPGFSPSAGLPAARQRAAPGWSPAGGSGGVGAGLVPARPAGSFGPLGSASGSFGAPVPERTGRASAGVPGVGSGTGSPAQANREGAPSAGAPAAGGGARQGGTGMGGVPMMGGGAGKGGAGNEHKRAGYLVAPEHTAQLVGELPLVAPPVIGS